ncbi:MAPK regulated corepressor interacting protein 2-like [Uloborus diversus]|uniref:MAPK regulated corepressor interacting protein 2-like n=1 Tax=Uloborus diversus TaxID=327109 RepID=UPI002409F06C|nr:MAPK regulated corepressor interacting protein 2-like [Uloborus diversus]
MLVAVKKKKSMYTVSNRPFKLLANTRRGITQKVDPLENTSSNRDSVKCGAQVSMSLPRPVFHQVNGRRTQVQKVHQENFPPQYEELIKYIQDTWTGIHKEYESSKQTSDNKVPKVVFYQDTNANTHLANFEPFDLESFWGERFLRNIQQST